MRGQNFLPATASPADSARSILIFRDKLELISISVLLFCSTRIISPGQMHLYLAFLLHRDYFGLLNASLSGFFTLQGLFRPGQLHLYLTLLFLRDYFGRPVASLSCSFAPQGLFPPVRCISVWLFCSTGIISPRSDASLSYSFVPQGLFRPARLRYCRNFSYSFSFSCFISIFLLLDVELPFSVCQEQPFWHH